MMVVMFNMNIFSHDDDDGDDDDDYDDDDWRWCFKTCPSLPHANPVLSKVNPTFQNEARGIFKTK